MARFGKRKIEDTKDYEGAKQYLNQSGLFEDVTIVAAWLNKNPKTKGETIALMLEKDGNTQIEFRAFPILNNDGSENDIGQKALHDLCYAVGLEGGINSLDEEPDETMELPIGKNKALVEVEVFSQLTDVVVSYVKINKYTSGDGNIYENVNFRSFYNNDTKASVGESAKLELGEEVEVGAKFAKDKEYYDGIQDATDYGNFTKDQIKAWIKAKRPKGTAGTIASTPYSRY